MIYTYTTEQTLPISIDKAWDFFSSPHNLALITPPDLSLQVLSSNGESEIFEGMEIPYTVKPLLGIKMRWLTKITHVNKQVSFVDKQIKGPYRLWEHTHQFVSTPVGTLIKDQVKYQLPMGAIGSFMHWLIVQKKVQDIFAFRRKVLKEMFDADTKK